MRNRATTVIRMRNGQGLAETAAALALLLPLFVLLVFVAQEVAQAYLIKDALTQAASKAARDLTIDYWQNNSIVGNRSQENVLAFDRIRIAGVINDSRQFSAPIFNTQAVPPTVTVTVTYTGGQYGLPPFPNPDPLHLGQSFSLSATSTQALE